MNACAELDSRSKGPMLVEREPRRQVNSNCRYVIDGKNSVLTGKVIDISRTGLFLTSPFDIPLKSLLHLVMGCDEQRIYTVKEIMSHPDKISGRVVRGSKSAGYGVLLLKTKKDRHPINLASTLSALTVQKKVVENSAVLTLEGSLDVTGAATLDRIAKELLRETSNLVLVMSDVESVLSSGVGVLINLFRDVRRRGGRLVVADPSYEVQRVLSISRADQLVSCYSSVDEALEALRPPGPASLAQPPEKGRLLTVLVLDDSPHSFRLVELALGQEFRLLHSSDVAECLQLAVENQPDIIIVDLQMPNTNRIRIVERLRQVSQAKDLPILMVTSEADKDEFEKHVGRMVQEYITKPYQSKDLLSTVRSLVEQNAMPGVRDSNQGAS